MVEFMHNVLSLPSKLLVVMLNTCISRWGLPIFAKNAFTLFYFEFSFLATVLPQFSRSNVKKFLSLRLGFSISYSKAYFLEQGSKIFFAFPSRRVPVAIGTLAALNIFPPGLTGLLRLGLWSPGLVPI